MRRRSVAILAAAGLLAGCANNNVFSLEVGQCLNAADLSRERVSDVPVVECQQPHDGEVYAMLDVPDGDYPGESALQAEAEQFCRTEFTSFVGIDYPLSLLDVAYLYPTGSSWDKLNDRSIVCIVIDPDGSVTGTLSGSRR